MMLPADLMKSIPKTVNSYKRTIFISNIYLPFVQVMRIVGTLLILSYGTVLVVHGAISLGLLAAFLEYQFSYFTPLTDILTAIRPIPVRYVSPGEDFRLVGYQV